MVCTIQTVEARWSGRPIAGIRELEQQQFRVEQIAGSHMTYHWSNKAPIGALTFNFNVSGASSSPAPESRVAGSGDLVIDVQKGFELSQQSRLTQSAGTKTLSSLFETAHGSCREQR